MSRPSLNPATFFGPTANIFRRGKIYFLFNENNLTVIYWEALLFGHWIACHRRRLTSNDQYLIHVMIVTP